MSYFIRQGSRLSVSDDANLEVHRTLPAGNYTVKLNPMTGFYLETVDAFPSLGKIYGNTMKFANRIMATFKDRPSTTGVLLSGEKGSGKTLLAKIISQMGAEVGYPTLTINQALHGEDFNKFIQTIDVPAIIIFDEFEKIYDDEAQQSLLTLFDGMYPTKKLFVMTCNDKWRIDSHMRNRPGRIFYALDFSGLDIDFIREYCEDNLKNKEHIESVCRASVLFSQFNFDMLKALVEEMNRFNEPAQDAMFMLNAKPQSSDNTTYDLTVFVNGKVLDQTAFHPHSWRGNPMTADFAVAIKLQDTKKIAKFTEPKRKVARLIRRNDEYDDDDDHFSNDLGALAVKVNSSRVHINAEEHMTNVDPKNSSFTYRNGNVTVELTRKQYSDDYYYSRLF